jgi:hypothetical protein
MRRPCFDLGIPLLAPALAGLALAASSPEPALACSVCMAGDPVFSTQGASAQSAGDLALYAQLQIFEKTAGSLEEAGELESADDQRLDLYAAWTPVDRLGITLDLPFSFNEIHEGGEVLRENGVGDLALSTSFVLWRNRDVLPTTWVEARAFVKAPTGDSDRTHGGEVDPHLQPGTGSWDFGGGLAAVHRLEWGALYGSASYRENRSGDFGDHSYAYGDVVLANLALEVPLGHATGRPALDVLTLGTELNFRWAEHDVFEGEEFEHSGGSILYLTPSLRIRLPFQVDERPVSLRTGVQIPLTSDWLHGVQREDEVWSVGLYLPL